MFRLRPLVLVVVAIVLAGVQILAAPVTVRLATLVPRNSIWYNALTEMGATWMKSTDGRVKLTIYEGGTQGDERTVIRLMRPEVDQLNASLLTAAGVAHIDDAFNVFGIPFFFQSDAEARHVRERLTPVLAKRLEAKGFHFVHWGHAGWVQVFSKTPIKSLPDLKRLKLFTSEGDDRTVQWYTQNGFKVVALKPTDIATGMTTGLIEAAPSPASVAAVIQLYRSADYMLDIRVAPLIGATVIADRIWTQISADDRAKVVAAGQTMEKRLDTEVPGQDAKAIDDMKLRNKRFTVVAPDAAGLAAFRAEAERLATTMRGTMVPADIYDLAVRERDAFRKSGGK
jgi:TRAP-type C4-dicarboxylate transport system substrate-binding protein